MLCVDVDADGPVDEIDLAAVENVVHNKASNGYDSSDGIELGEGEQAMKAAEDIRTNADAEVQGDEVRRQGNADAVRRRQFNADSLTVGHERTLSLIHI